MAPFDITVSLEQLSFGFVEIDWWILDLEWVAHAYAA